jgi:hypothetical protein
VIVYTLLSRLCAMNPRMAMDCIACAVMSPLHNGVIYIAERSRRSQGRANGLRWSAMPVKPVAAGYPDRCRMRSARNPPQRLQAL